MDFTKERQKESLTHLCPDLALPLAFQSKVSELAEALLAGVPGPADVDALAWRKMSMQHADNFRASQVTLSQRQTPRFTVVVAVRVVLTVVLGLAPVAVILLIARTSVAAGAAVTAGTVVEKVPVLQQQHRLTRIFRKSVRTQNN